MPLREAAILCLLLGLTAVVWSAPSPGAAATVESMSTLLDGLTTAFRISLEPDGFEERANKKKLRRALGQLAEGSRGLADHGGGLDESTAWLRDRMADDADAALADFEDGRTGMARSRVRQLAEHCFSCHTRLPGPAAGAATVFFSEEVERDGLSLREEVLFLVATRRFDDALAVTERALRDPAGAGAGLSWLFEDYLKVAIRVNPSYRRAREALQSFLEATRPTPYFAGRVEAWIADLEAMEKSGQPAADLENARTLLNKGRARNEFPADQRGLVYFVAASGTLLRYLESDDIADARRAEAYYLLGIAESHISSTMWSDQAPFFLESAIRLHPHSDLAMDAHEFLLEYTIVENSGASGTFVPDDAWKRLEELGALAEPE